MCILIYKRYWSVRSTDPTSYRSRAIIVSLCWRVYIDTSDLTTELFRSKSMLWSIHLEEPVFVVFTTNESIILQMLVFTSIVKIQDRLWEVDCIYFYIIKYTIKTVFKIIIIQIFQFRKRHSNMFRFRFVHPHLQEILVST